MSLIDDIKRDREAGTPGRWVSPYELYDNGWELETGGENTYVGIGPKCAGQSKPPVAITAVESAFGRDAVVDANARRIARVPDMEAALLAADRLAYEAGFLNSASPLGGYSDRQLSIDRAVVADILKALAAYREAVK